MKIVGAIVFSHKRSLLASTIQPSMKHGTICYYMTITKVASYNHDARANVWPNNPRRNLLNRAIQPPIYVSNSLYGTLVNVSICLRRPWTPTEVSQNKYTNTEAHSCLQIPWHSHLAIITNAKIIEQHMHTVYWAIIYFVYNLDIRCVLLLPIFSIFIVYVPGP